MENTRPVRTIVEMDEPDLQLVFSKYRERAVAKGKLILKKGQIADQYFFIVLGDVRFFYEEKPEQVLEAVIPFPGIIILLFKKFTLDFRKLF